MKTGANGSAAAAPPLISSEGFLDLEAHLQQPIEDATIMRDLRTLRAYIEIHVDKFYHSEALNVTVDDLITDLRERPWNNSEDVAVKLASLLVEPEFRAAGIRTMIARTIFTSINFLGNHHDTVLCPEAVKLVSTFEKQDWPEEWQEVYQLALSRWRILSTFLLSEPHRKEPYSGSEKRAERLAASMETVLEHLLDNRFAHGAGKGQWSDNLSTITSKASRLGAVMFAQPSTWEFRWELLSANAVQETASGQGKRSRKPQDGMIVFPAILKTGDLDGRKLANPVLKEDAEVDSSIFKKQPSLAKEFVLKRKDSLQPKTSSPQKQLPLTPTAPAPLYVSEPRPTVEPQEELQSTRRPSETGLPIQGNRMQTTRRPSEAALPIQGNKRNEHETDLSPKPGREENSASQRRSVKGHVSQAIDHVPHTIKTMGRSIFGGKTETDTKSEPAKLRRYQRNSSKPEPDKKTSNSSCSQEENAMHDDLTQLPESDLDDDDHLDSLQVS